MNEKNDLNVKESYENEIYLDKIALNQFKKKRSQLLDYISFVKIISAYSVIILHTNQDSFFNFKKTKRWILINFIEHTFYYGVPFFVLCIGATLLDFNEKYGLIEYYKRRFLKVVFPLLVWNIISYYYRIYFVKNLIRQKFDIVYLLNLFFQSKLYGLFYSFHIFIITYMIIPLLAYVEKSKKIKIYSYCFFSLLITQSLIPYLMNILNIYLYWPYKIDAGYIIYIFSGYLIQNYIFSFRMKVVIFVFGFISYLIQLIATLVLSLKYNRLIQKHFGYLTFPTIIYCNSLFLFIKEYCFLLFKFVNKKIINKIGSLTIGPFFLHWPVIDFFNKYPFLLFNINIFTFYGGTIKRIYSNKMIIYK